MSRVISPGAFVLVLCLLLISVAAADDDTAKKRGMFGFRIGQYGSGTLTAIEKATDVETEYDTESGTTYGLFLDYPITHRIYVGITFDISKLDFGRAEENLMNGGLAIKYNLTNRNSKIILRPSAQIGYAMLPSTLGYKSTNYITFYASGEIINKVAEKFGIMGDIGLFWGLSGGNNEYDVTGGPMLIIRGGFVFL
jgi:hypothetical protein